MSSVCGGGRWSVICGRGGAPLVCVCLLACCSIQELPCDRGFMRTLGETQQELVQSAAQQMPVCWPAPCWLC